MSEVSYNIPTEKISEMFGLADWCMEYLIYERDLCKKIGDNDVLVPLDTMLTAFHQLDSVAKDISTECEKLKEFGAETDEFIEQKQGTVDAVRMAMFFVAKVVRNLLKQNKHLTPEQDTLYECWSAITDNVDEALKRWDRIKQEKQDCGTGEVQQPAA